jgi:hypothetical protein
MADKTVITILATCCGMLVWIAAIAWLGSV